MGIDWGYAFQVGGFGFALVFAVLSILAVSIWLVGLVARKISSGKAEISDSKKGD